ncbi:hypothetical protein [Orenia marismortui]|uniref:hypothetical protein n=1 Tax=Orenia marismortui TaxID=46469 RepID=UPI00037F2B00|nr:hypothetical protein [Orenia marismortui]
MKSSNSQELKFLIRIAQLSDSLLRKIVNENKENLNAIVKDFFGIDLANDIETILENLVSKINQEKKIISKSEKNSKGKELKLYYNDIEDVDIKQITNLCIAVGLPTESFELAEECYYKIVEEDEDYANGNYKALNFIGDGLGGAFAQYTTMLSAGNGDNYQCITRNSIGIKNFTEFKGNEFLGYSLGIKLFLENILKEDNSMNYLLTKLKKKGVIKGGNISYSYRESIENVNAEKLKYILTEILFTNYSGEKKDLRKKVEVAFDPKIVERKMRFIDNYKIYQERIKAEKQRVINYIISSNFGSRVLRHIGSSYLVDQNLESFSGGIDQELIKRIESLEEDQLDSLLEARVDLFEPYMLLAEGANAKSAKNRFRKKPNIGNMTNNLSLDYLRSLVKDIIIDLNAKDKEIIKEVFRLSRRGTGKEFLSIIKDRLRHSMYLQKKISKEEFDYECTFLQENPDLLTDKAKVYRLDQAALNQLQRMKYTELKDLWKWELTGGGIFLKLGKKLEDGEEAKEYHSSNPAEKFSNEEERLKIDLQEPSINRIYGSLKQKKYLEPKDTDYLNQDNDIYEFAANQGVGFEILSEHSSLNRNIKVDNQDISGSYKQKKREEADIGSRNKTLRDKYFGDNIILRDDYKLIYIYGSNKENELIIDGFKNGDYGINLVEQSKEGQDSKVPLTYTSYKIKFDNFEFIALDRLEIKKSIYDHTRVSVAGLINEDNFSAYEKYLAQEDPKLVITYNNNDDTKILFKGIIEDYSIAYENHDYYLELKALSYSVLLERRRINRIYQNLGTTYNQVFAKLMDQNSEFNLAFAEDAVGNTELVSADYPVVLQYKENEWDFIKRISSYLNQLLIVDDTKDSSEKINIQVGAHNLPAKNLNNIKGSKKKKIGKRFNEFNYYKVDHHGHFRSEGIFDLGRKVKYKVNNQEDNTLELTIIKNRIYVEGGILYSDLTLVAQEDLRLEKELRKAPIKGRSFRAEVKKLNNKHKAQVLFRDLEDEYDQAASFWIPIDKPYTNAYFSPEVGDIVDIIFKAKNEKHLTLKSSSIDKEQEVEWEASDKLLYTPGGYQMKVNNQKILLAAKDNKSALEVKEELINLVSSKQQLKLSKEEISAQGEKGEFGLDDQRVLFKFGSKNVMIDDSGINIL